MFGMTEYAPGGATAQIPHPLVGVWELQAATWDDEPLEGGVPHACLLFTPRGKTVALLVAEGRYGARCEWVTAAFRAAFAYSGSYRVVGDAWITTLQRSWNDLAVDGEQTHFFSIEGEVMTVRSGRGEFSFRKRT